mgnify:CR=1 FL=1
MTGELVQLIDEAAAQENATAVVVLRRRTGEVPTSESRRANTTCAAVNKN